MFKSWFCSYKTEEYKKMQDSAPDDVAEAVETLRAYCNNRLCSQCLYGQTDKKVPACAVGKPYMWEIGEVKIDEE